MPDVWGGETDNFYYSRMEKKEKKGDKRGKKEYPSIRNNIQYLPWMNFLLCNG